MTAEFDLAKRIRDIVKIDPAAKALKYGSKWYSWGNVSRFMEQLALLFSGADLPEGAPVGILLRNNPASVCALLEVLASRRCVITLNPFQSPEKILQDVGRIELSALVAEASDWNAIPGLTDAIRQSGAIGVSMNAGELSVKLQAGSALPSVLASRSMGSIAIMMQSSGTTGPAKRIPLPYDKFEQSLMSAAAYESRSASTQTLVLKETPAMLTTPLVHIGGMYFSVAAVVAGRPLLIFEKFNVEEWANGVAEHQINMTALPPTALQMILDACVPSEKIRSLRAVRAGSAPLPPALQEKFESTYGIPVLDSYGATEFAGAIAGWSLKDHQTYSRTKRGSVGRAQPGNELRVVDPDTESVLPVGVTGLLEVRSAQMDSARWVRTNDLADIDDEGFLYIRGRADSAIIRGGFKVIPADIEAVIKSHDQVSDASVVGLPDTRLGALPVAAVVLKPGASLDEAALTLFLKQRLVAYQVPAKILFTDALPRTPSLKISQPDVVAMFSQSVHAPA